MSHNELMIRAIANDRVREANTARRSLAMGAARRETRVRRRRRQRMRLRAA